MFDLSFTHVPVRGPGRAPHPRAGATRPAVLPLRLASLAIVFLLLGLGFGFALASFAA